MNDLPTLGLAVFLTANLFYVIGFWRGMAKADKVNQALHSKMRANGQAFVEKISTIANGRRSP